MDETKFSDPRTASQFKTLTDKDPQVLVPKTNRHGEYYGPLSMVPAEVASSMVAQQSNLLMPIAPSTAPVKVTAAASGGSASK